MSIRFRTSTRSDGSASPLCVPIVSEVPVPPSPSALMPPASDEGPFQHLASLAKTLLDVPAVIVALVTGLPDRGPSAFPQSVSADAFRHTILDRDAPLVVGDAATDVRTRHGMHATDAAAWLCHRMEACDGGTLGMFCVLTAAPRVWTDWDKELVAGLACAAETELRRMLGLPDPSRPVPDPPIGGDSIVHIAVAKPHLPSRPVRRGRRPRGR